MTKDEQIETLLTKGVQEVLPSKGAVETLLKSGKRLSIYVGVDPTGPTLHIGHAIQLRKLRQFQDLGHTIIFLVGDFTARIGDPTDKLSTRTQLTAREVKRNFAIYKKQAGQFIRFSGKGAAKVRFNSRWLGKLRFGEVLELASLVTVDYMLKRDMFVRRMEEEKPIYLHEFMYPLMQGYDSVVLDVDGEIGGNDQLFNMLTGRTLLKKIKNKEKFVITVKLLADTTGEKMGKTTGNMIALSDHPNDMFGKVMSWNDGMIVPGFELCTDYSIAQIETIKKRLSQGENPRDLKLLLAFEITKTVVGEKMAQKAQDHFIALFQKGEHSGDVIKIQTRGTLKETIIAAGVVHSSGELRTLVEGGAVVFVSNNKKMTIPDLSIKPEKGLYRIGKHRFCEII